MEELLIEQPPIRDLVEEYVALLTTVELAALLADVRPDLNDFAELEALVVRFKNCWGEVDLESLIFAGLDAEAGDPA